MNIKKYRWSSIQIDSRQITLDNKAYSLMTDNSFDLQSVESEEEKDDDREDEEEQKHQENDNDEKAS